MEYVMIFCTVIEIGHEVMVRYLSRHNKSKIVVGLLAIVTVPSSIHFLI